jgi:hypothetical protein
MEKINQDKTSRLKISILRLCIILYRLIYNGLIIKRERIISKLLECIMLYKRRLTKLSIGRMNQPESYVYNTYINDTINK